MSRYTTTTETDLREMLAAIGVGSIDELFDKQIPEGVRLRRALDLPDGMPEQDVYAHLRELSAKNVSAEDEITFLGAGMYDHYVPALIDMLMSRSEFLTPYTPYQPEISQGGLQVMFEYQTAISELTALPVSNASVYEGPSAVAAAGYLAKLQNGKGRFVVSAGLHPHSIETLRTYAHGYGIEVVEVPLSGGVTDAAAWADAIDDDTAAVFFAQPNVLGAVEDAEVLSAAAKDSPAVVVAQVDPLTLGILKPPGESGVDIAVGEGQTLGNRLDFGGPSFGFFAAREAYMRKMPGRIAGQTKDVDGRRGFVLTLQTREQHIRREKATSNICTAQVLLAVMASMYAVYHGPDGLRTIARRVHRLASVLAAGLREGGVELAAEAFFDTVTAHVPGRGEQIVAAARDAGINLRLVDADTVSIACDEATTREHVAAVWTAFAVGADVDALDADLPLGTERNTPFLTHPVFTAHHSETAMLRYLRRLSDRDYALDRGMIPLGSCTMKLNATTEMEPVTNPGFAQLHPFAPADQFAGYAELFEDLQTWLAEITGYDAVSLQPNAGSQGEFAGLLAIRNYHLANGDDHRTVCLIPASAHGTNAASAVMAGMRVVVVKTGGEQGEIDLADLKAKITENADSLAAIMLTYPSTHGVFEDHVGEVCALVHDAGGQVYVDGANLNAMVGLARPGKFGADVSHLNLHKTFCIPHGGGGPGVGPIGVRAHLAPYLPNHPLQPAAGPGTGSGAIAGAPWGSASILPITWAYIRMMGPDGLTAATGAAILSANYVARRLDEHFPVLYTGAHDLVAHECILDLRGITRTTGVTVDDVAKRLIDYGFHAPTMSFPVAGTLMVEPTESEDLHELDRFVAAMIAIKGEIDAVAAGTWPAGDNPLANAPHTAECLTEEWDHPYERALAAFPAGVDPRSKYWPPVRRIDGAFGDRNLVCSCPPVDAYA